MAPNLRYSAAKSSTIGRRSASLSPTKQRTLRNILPTQTKYLQNLKKAPKSSSNEDALTVQDYNVQLDYQLSAKNDIMVAIDTVLENQWAESTTLHHRFHTKDEMDASDSDEQLLFLLPGLSMEVKADILKYRKSHLPIGLLTLNQLYSIYDKQGPTYVDRNLELRLREGKVRKFVITNAAPVVLRTQNKYQGKVTYGHENVEVIVKSEQYYELIEREVEAIDSEAEKCNSKQESERLKLQSTTLKKYLHFLKGNPSALYIHSDDFASAELSTLVSLGYVTLTSNHLNEIESHQYSVAYPNCGTFLKLINSGRAWLVKTLNKSKHKELLEENLFQKWEGYSANGTPKMTNFRKPFYGYDLFWILADALGAGVVEVFNTPVGRGWKLTGKV